MTNGRIKKIAGMLKNSPHVEFAYLFGSRAKGKADERSDWDIAVYFKRDPKDLPDWTVFYLEAELSRELGGEVQVTALNKIDSPVFLFQVISDGILLVDNNTSKRITFEAEALRKYHDWGYYLKRQMAG